MLLQPLIIFQDPVGSTLQAAYSLWNMSDNKLSFATATTHSIIRSGGQCPLWSSGPLKLYDSWNNISCYETDNELGFATATTQRITGSGEQHPSRSSWPLKLPIG